jgi:hypothetical protein
MDFARESFAGRRPQAIASARRVDTEFVKKAAAVCRGGSKVSYRAMTSLIQLTVEDIRQQLRSDPATAWVADVIEEPRVDQAVRGAAVNESGSNRFVWNVCFKCDKLSESDHRDCEFCGEKTNHFIYSSIYSWLAKVLSNTYLKSLIQQTEPQASRCRTMRQQGRGAEIVLGAPCTGERWRHASPGPPLLHLELSIDGVQRIARGE